MEIVFIFNAMEQWPFHLAVDGRTEPYTNGSLFDRKVFDAIDPRHEQRTFPLKICRRLCVGAGRLAGWLVGWIRYVWRGIICHSKRLTPKSLGNKKFICKLKCLINWEWCLLNETHTKFNRHSSPPPFPARPRNYLRFCIFRNLVSSTSPC